MTKSEQIEYNKIRLQGLAILTRWCATYIDSAYKTDMDKLAFKAKKFQERAMKFVEKINQRPKV